MLDPDPFHHDPNTVPAQVPRQQCQQEEQEPPKQNGTHRVNEGGTNASEERRPRQTRVAIAENFMVTEEWNL